MSDLTWETQADWDAAQSRAGVVTRAIGDRVADEVWQGYDPNDSALTDSVSYWTMDESGSTVSDVIGAHDGTVVGAQAGQTGLLSSTAFSFDAVDGRVEVDSMPLADPGASWTVNLWVNLDGGGTHQLFFSLEDSAAAESLGVGVWNNDSTKIYSAGRTPGTGSAFPIGSWTMVTLRWDGSAETAELFVDATFDYDVSPSGGASPFSNADQITIGDRRVGTSDPLSGRLDEPILFDRALSASEIQDLYDVASAGSLETATQQNSGKAVEVTTDADVPTNTSIDLTVYQDVNETTNSETVALDGGTNTYPLSAFEVGGTDYWVDASLSTTDTQKTARLQSATVTTESPSVTLSASAADLDSSAATVLAGDFDVTPGETLTVESGETYTHESSFNNAGTVDNAGTFALTTQSLDGTVTLAASATDLDSSIATADTTVPWVTASAVDPDTAVGSISRTRELATTTSSDSDASTSTIDKWTTLSPTGSDPDVGVAAIFTTAPDRIEHWADPLDVTVARVADPIEATVFRTAIPLDAPIAETSDPVDIAISGAAEPIEATVTRNSEVLIAWIHNKHDNQD